MSNSKPSLNCCVSSEDLSGVSISSARLRRKLLQKEVRCD